jgi:hypothetical protein
MRNHQYPVAPVLVRLLVGLAFFLLLPGSLLANVTATLDRDRIVQGETVTLTIQTNNPQQNLDPNLDELQTDFILLDRRSETQMSIVNGQQSAVMRLLLTLEPKRTGELQVPALKLGDQSTSPMSLFVEDPPEVPEGEMPPVFIEIEIDPSDGPYYVHAQMRLTVRVFYLANLTEAAITPPEPANASVRLLDEVPFQAERGDVRYRVLERHYAVFPERSGPLVIPEMTLTGRLVERRSDRLWQPSVRGRRIQAGSDPVELEILPRPANFTGDHWLPARQLQATQTISASDSPTVGEPVTRTIILDAIGLEENMLTEASWPEIPAARVYPDQPQGITRDDGRWVLGHKEFRYAVVPEEVGELVLPELKIQWWDTINNRQQTAILPEKRLNISPSAMQLDEPATVAGTPGLPGRDSLDSMGNPGSDGVNRLWQWLTLLFAALWLLTLAAFLRRRSPGAQAVTTVGQTSEAESALLKRLQTACEQADAGEARKALSRWLKRYGPEHLGGSIVELARQVPDSDLARYLRALDAVGFQHDPSTDWDAAGLWSAFKAWEKDRQRNDKPSPESVTDLYART